MNKLGAILQELREMDQEACGFGWLHKVHPAVKLLITILYILFVVSYSKYNIAGLICMAVYPVILCLTGDLSTGKLIKRMKAFFVLAFFLGIANPFLDRTVLLSLGNVKITGGMLSMLSLFLKGILAVSASYILVVTTSMNDICYALRSFHIPKIFVSIFQLIYRYIFVLFEQGDRMIQAYTLRAPNQKGLHYKVWGSMIGQMLLRSMDMAEVVYASMLLRGFHGEYIYREKKMIKKTDLLYGTVCLIAFAIVKGIMG